MGRKKSKPGHIPAWKAKASAWATKNSGKPCACGCGMPIKLTHLHFYRQDRLPTSIRGHAIRIRGKSKAQRWIDENQGKHLCQCGCGQPILIKIHHHTRGIPKFLDFHASKIIKPGTGKFGSLNPHYKGGRYVDKKGYVQVLVPGPGRSKYEFEHRQIVAKKLGRTLGTDETVHHENRKKSDNKPGNLKLESRSEHSRLHALAGETGFLLLKKRGISWHGKRRAK